VSFEVECAGGALIYQGVHVESAGLQRIVEESEDCVQLCWCFFFGPAPPVDWRVLCAPLERAEYLRATDESQLEILKLN
jgi:hypothetical protein